MLYLMKYYRYRYSGNVYAIGAVLTQYTLIWLAGLAAFVCLCKQKILYPNIRVIVTSFKEIIRSTPSISKYLNVFYLFLFIFIFLIELIVRDSKWYLAFSIPVFLDIIS